MLYKHFVYCLIKGINMLFTISHIILLTILLFLMMNRKIYQFGIIAWRISIMLLILNIVSMIVFYPNWENYHYANMILLAPTIFFPFLTEKTFCNFCNHKTYIRFLYSNHCPNCKKNIFSKRD